MRILKRVTTVVAALALTVGMSSNCFAASTWGSYFGAPAWYEAAEGSLSGQSDTGWTANMKVIGWGGCWGAQVYQDSTKGNGKVDVKKGSTYELKCTLKSTNIDKWAFIKVSTKESYAFGKWVLLKKGKATTINEKFTAKADAKSIYFGLGGDFGDRTDAGGLNAYKWASTKPKDKDASLATKIVCTGFSLEEAGAAKNTSNESATTTSTGTTSTSTTDTTVATGDFTPIACGAVAVIAATAVVVFARKRETN